MINECVNDLSLSLSLLQTCPNFTREGINEGCAYATGWFHKFLSESHANCRFMLLQMNGAICFCNTMLANLLPNKHSVIMLFRPQSDRQFHLCKLMLQRLNYPFSGFFSLFCQSPPPPRSSVFGVPFTDLHDIQLRPCGADKAVGHRGSSRWCLLTRPWCFPQSSNHSLKRCSDRAELTAESCNYFQVTEKCHSQKTVGIYQRDRCLISHVCFVFIFRSSPRDFVAVFVAAIQDVLPPNFPKELLMFLLWYCFSSEQWNK